MRTDAKLVAAYAATRDEDAFAELTRRHGVMVYRICMRMLSDSHEAEDASQAVFVVLARKARSLRREVNLAAWLHSVARNVSLRSLQARSRRAKREKEAAMVQAREQQGAVGPEGDRALEWLDQELGSLPAPQRQAVILRYLEDRSQEEAARLAGCPQGTLSKRASRGLERLRQRLAGRGSVLSGVMLVGLLEGEAQGAVPATLLPSLAVASKIAAAGAAAGATGTGVPALAEGALKMMFWAKVKIAAALIGAAVVVSAGVPATVQAIWAAEKEKKPAAGPAILPHVFPEPQNAHYGSELVPLGKEIVLIGPASERLAVTLGKVAGEWGVKVVSRQRARNYSTIKIRHGSALEAAKRSEANGPQGYKLSISKATNGAVIEITGGDEAGAFYALQSLRQLALKDRSGVRVRAVKIKDWPAFKRRGLIFFDRTESVLRVLSLASRFKLNYFQGEGARDSLHEKVVRQMKAVQKFCKAHHIEYCAHLGRKDVLSKLSREKLLKYYDERYRLGFRSFTVNFDDSSLKTAEQGRSAANIHAGATAAVYRYLRKLDPNVRLIMCPIPYGGLPEKGFRFCSKEAGQSYFGVVKAKLPRDVPLFWTGDGGVFSPKVTAEGAKKCGEAAGRKPFFWDNDPIRFANKRQPLSGREAKLYKEVAGYVANLNKAETRWGKATRNAEFTLLTVAMYTWNPEKYDPKKAAAAAQLILVQEGMRDPMKALGLKEVKASGISALSSPKDAFDGDPHTGWNAGSLPPAWIEFRFKKPSLVKGLALTVSQKPAGNTIHEVKATFIDGSEKIVHTFTGPTKSGVVLRAKFDPPLEKVAAVRVTTRKSPSWVGWTEITWE